MLSSEKCQRKDHLQVGRLTVWGEIQLNSFSPGVQLTSTNKKQTCDAAPGSCPGSCHVLFFQTFPVNYKGGARIMEIGPIRNHMEAKEKACPGYY